MTKLRLFPDESKATQAPPLHETSIEQPTGKSDVQPAGAVVSAHPPSAAQVCPVAQHPPSQKTGLSTGHVWGWAADPAALSSTPASTAGAMMPTEIE
jgi:hypothetical protein